MNRQKMEHLTSWAHFKQKANNEFQFYPSSVSILTFAGVLMYHTNDETPTHVQTFIPLKKEFLSHLCITLSI